MFYTLTNQFLIKKSGGDNEFLYVFLIGSAVYVALHWYLHMEERDGVMGKLREYLYYLLVLDFVTCLIIYKMTPIKDNADADKLEAEEKKEITLDEKKAILQKMQEARKLQQKLLREKEAVADKKNGDREEKDITIGVKKEQTPTDCEKEGKCPIFKSSDTNDNAVDNANKREKENSDNHTIVSKNKSKKKMRQEKITDTDIPIFTQNTPKP